MSEEDLEESIDEMIHEEHLDERLDEEEPISEEFQHEMEDYAAESAQRAHDEAASRIRAASSELEQRVFGTAATGESSLAMAEVDLHEARMKLEIHKVKSAERSVRRVENALYDLEEDVIDLRRHISMINRMLQDIEITDEDDMINTLSRLRDATYAAEMGEVSHAAYELEGLIGDLIGGDTTSLNPFLFRNFWLGIDTRWPAAASGGHLMVRLVNDGDRPIPPMRFTAPVPDGWIADPQTVDVPVVRPGAHLPIRFDITPDKMTSDMVPLPRKLALQTAYEVRSGFVTAVIRAQNRSMETLRDLILEPWMPPGYTAMELPIISKLEPDEEAIVRMPLIIDMGTGGSD